MEKVYPRLSEMCRHKYGLEFQVSPSLINLTKQGYSMCPPSVVQCVHATQYMAYYIMNVHVFSCM